jgi:hypothetical protein
MERCSASGPESFMSTAEPAKERLREAIERLRNDIDRVEFWADALDRLAQPIPEYRVSDHLSQHLLPSSHRQRRGNH